jgi:chondroitin 4-sulfotransferase 11
MIYSQEKRLLFAHVSRTGGVAITNYLLDSLTDSEKLSGQHGPLAAARDELGSRFDQAFKFAFVRNPWDRLMSWHALIGQVTAERGDDLLDPDSAHWDGFDAFLESWSAEKIQVDGVTRLRLSQWGQLVDADGVLLADDLGRFETFAEDSVRLFAKAGMAGRVLPTVNASRHHHYSAYYSDFGRDLIAETFSKDVEQFAYQFEDVG